MLVWFYHAFSFDFALEDAASRALVAAVAGFAVALALGPRAIAWLRLRCREPIRSDSPRLNELHRGKHATPTMGGLFIVAGLLAALLLLCDLANPYVQAAAVTAVGLAAIGALDDLVKVRGPKKGLSVRAKLAGQVVVASAAAYLVYHEHARTPDGLLCRLPMLGDFTLGSWFLPLAVIVIVASSNAVNLTDGLDGLAGGCLVLATMAMALVVFVAGHAQADETLVVAGAMIGGMLGFLRFNCHPAQVFMGDTGSLPLGGLLGLLAVIARQELLWVIIGGVFVAEAASVLLQVGWYRACGRRLLRCAPLHHHFEFAGLPEGRIVVRFWIASALCALAGLASLRLLGGQ